MSYRRVEQERVFWNHVMTSPKYFCLNRFLLRKCLKTVNGNTKVQFINMRSSFLKLIFWRVCYDQKECVIYTCEKLRNCKSHQFWLNVWFLVETFFKMISFVYSRMTYGFQVYWRIWSKVGLHSREEKCHH